MSRVRLAEQPHGMEAVTPLQEALALLHRALEVASVDQRTFASFVACLSIRCAGENARLLDGEWRHTEPEERLP